MEESGMGAPQGAGGLSKDEKMWGMLCHLAAIVGLFGIPFVGLVVGPLVVWLIKREKMPFVNDQGKEALNFQIIMLICMVIGLALASQGNRVGLGLILVISVTDLVLMIIGALKANQGVAYRYPFAIRLIK